jgi:hypothetical protein
MESRDNTEDACKFEDAAQLWEDLCLPKFEVTGHLYGRCMR